MKILAICGSLRSKSYNLAILLEARSQWNKITEFDLFNQLEEIPPFNPDRETPPPSVVDLRARVLSADTILVASPEYVHGIPGALKNALDWLVGSGEWDGKCTAIINVTPSAMEPQYVREGLAEVLRVMSGGNLVEQASFVVTAAFKKFDAEGRITDQALRAQLAHSLKALEQAVKDRKK